MAIIKNFDDEDQNNPNNSQQSSFVGSQPGSTPFSQQKSSSKGFQNLQKFMQANKDSNMQSSIIGNIKGRSDKLGGQVEGSRQKFLSDTDTEKQRLEGAESTTQQAIGNYQNLGVGDIASGTQNLSDQYKSQIEDVRKLRRGDFKSDYDVSDLAKQQLNVDRFKGLTSGALSEKGRFNILNKSFGGLSGYTPNLARTDQLLLQSAGAEKVKQLDKSLRGFGEENIGRLQGLKDTRASRNELLKQLGQQAQETTTGLLSSNRQQLETDLGQKAENYKKDVINKQELIRNKMISGEALSQQDADILKLKPDEEYVKFYNANRLRTVSPDREKIIERAAPGSEADIRQYLTAKDTSGVGWKDVVAKEELAKSIALSRLAEDESLLRETGQYADLDAGRFLELDKGKSVADIEKAFQIGRDETGDWSARVGGLSDLGDTRVARGGQSPTQALDAIRSQLAGNDGSYWDTRQKTRQAVDKRRNELLRQQSLMEKTLQGANTDEIIRRAQTDALRKLIDSGGISDIGKING